MSAVKINLRQRHEQELRNILKRDAKEFASLYQIGKYITSTFDLNEILDFITKKVAEIMKADVCTVRLFEGKNRLVLRSSFGLDFKLSSDSKKDIKLGEGILGKVVKGAKPIIIRDLSKEPSFKKSPLYSHKKLKSLIAVPLVEMHNVIGAFSVYSKKENFYRKEDRGILSLFASQATIAIENAKLFEKTRSNYINTMRFFASLIDVKEKYTGDHSTRVMKNVLKLADRLDLTYRQKEILRYASLLHDIGKIAIDSSILTKQGPLTEEEWKQMKTHPLVGAHIIKKIGFLDDLIPVIMHHHERYDGGGYPDGTIKANQIPLEARILSVADSYEAMTSDRPYRKALSEDEAVQELKKNAGTQFDPNIVEVFLEILKKPK